MSRSIRVVSLVALCAVVASCASGGGRASVRPPELLTTTKPELAPSGITPNGARASLIAEIQVVVNTSGKADVRTR